MPEVLGLRELGGEEPDGAGVAAGAEDGAAEAAPVVGPPRWRRRAAVAVVGLLLLAVGYMLSAGSPRGGGVPPTTEAPPVESPVEKAVRAALDAWAKFASTGDLGPVRATFDPAGPQLARLNSEAAGVKARPAGGGPYTFSAKVFGVGSGRDRDEQLVTADVVVTRSGEADQRFTWELVMRHTDGRWLLWTVRDRASSVAATTRGGAP